MEEKKEHGRGAGVRLVFPCSGAADTGEISDRAARQLTRDGFARMVCLAGIAAPTPHILEAARGAAEIWAIDGCDFDCARHTLERAGLSGVRHVRVTDCGLQKRGSPATEQNVAVVMRRMRG